MITSYLGPSVGQNYKGHLNNLNQFFRYSMVKESPKIFHGGRE